MNSFNHKQKMYEYHLLLIEYLVFLGIGKEVTVEMFIL